MAVEILVKRNLPHTAKPISHNIKSGCENLRIFFEPTDRRKATKPFQTQHWKSITFASPNYNELIAMANTLGYLQKGNDENTIDNILKMSVYIMDHIDNLLVTLGEQGVLLLRKAKSDNVFFTMKNGFLSYEKPIDGALQARLYKVKKEVDLVSVSGAGDSLASGFIYAMLQGMEESVCMSVAIESARVALFSKDPVPDILFDGNHQCWLRKHPFEILI